MADKRLSIFVLGITFVVSFGAVWAQGPANETPQSSSASERLAWSIQAYVPCDWTSSLATIEAEIATAGANNQEIGQALRMVLGSEEVCDPVKDASARLLTRLPEASPDTQDATISAEIAEITELLVIPVEETATSIEPDIDVSTVAEEVELTDDLTDSATASPVDDTRVAEVGDAEVGDNVLTSVTQPELIVPEQALDVTFRMRLPPRNPAFAGN